MGIFSNQNVNWDMIEVNKRIPEEICKKVDAIIEKEYPKDTYMLGICHSIWRREKELYAEFGYTWYSPSEIEPFTCFD